MFDEFEEYAKSVRGKVSHAPIAYLLCPNSFPPPDQDEPADEYADFDHELIARHPIIQRKHRHVPVATLEAGGPKMKMPHVNLDNTQLFSLVKTTFENTTWWIHARKAVRTKDGRRAILLMAGSLMSTNAMDEANTKNRRDILALEYKGDSRNWSLLSYTGEYKRYHAIQANHHLAHNFNDFSEREKVTNLIGSIKTGEYDIPIVNIQNDTFGAPINFDKANERLIEHKTLIDGREKNNIRNVSHLEGGGRGRGGGGRHGGGRGGGRGRGQGQGRGGRTDGGRPDSSNRTKHKNTVGGHALNVAKISNGNWDTVAISRGEYDALAKKQTHINENWYPSNRYLELEPLERRMLSINQQAQKAAEGGRPV